MKIAKIISESGNDFSAIMECEHCGHTAEITNGYHDGFYHARVIPAMSCKKCGKNRAGEIEHTDAGCRLAGHNWKTQTGDSDMSGKVDGSDIENHMLHGDPPGCYTASEEAALDERAAEIARAWLEDASPDLDRITGLIEANAADLAPLIAALFRSTDEDEVLEAIYVLQMALLSYAATDWYADARAMAEREYAEGST